MPAKKKKKRKTKRKTTRKKKAKKADKPKRGMSSFMFFSKFNRTSIHERCPGISASEVAVKLGEIWRSLDDVKKAKWSKYAKTQNEKDKQLFYAKNPMSKPKAKPAPSKKRTKLLNLPLRSLSALPPSSSSSVNLLKKTWVCPSCKYVNPSFTGSCKICYTRLVGSGGPPVPRKLNRVSGSRDPTSVKFPKLRRFLHESDLLEVYDRLERQNVGFKLLIQIVREGGGDLHELLPSIGNRRRVVEAVNRQYPKSQQSGTVPKEKLLDTPQSKEQSPRGLTTYKVVLEHMVRQKHISEENLDMLKRLRAENDISNEQHKHLLLELGVTVEDLEEKRHTTPKDAVNECVVCLDAPSTIAIQPCGHLALCQDCSPNFDPSLESSTLNKCPRCRQKISNLLRIY